MGGGGAVAGVWSPQPLEANGDLVAKPQSSEARVSRGGAPALGDFYNFSTKITHF